ncbi:putative transposase [Candidatus Midichloria mitochondrii IricVA]|uniref:Putative transposase n=2 Tax=Candidatus Midichloria mitochondrii TaxID=234827 RepID=F7XW56_MIDMI|nr:putative transposase [Candidatus Midichloria mitochondrii IricVA]
MRDAVIPLVILLNCCKGKQTGTLTQQKAGKVCHNLCISRNKVLKGIAQRGKTSTRMVLWPQ